MRYFKKDSKLPSFLPLPCYMMNYEFSSTSKIVYAKLLHLTTISAKNDWVDENGNVYVICTVSSLAHALKCSDRTVKTALLDLERFDLICRKRMGLNKPNRIYVRIPYVDLNEIYDYNEFLEVMACDTWYPPTYFPPGICFGSYKTDNLHS